MNRVARNTAAPRSIELVVIEGHNTPVMHGIEEVLSRPARDFSEYVRKTAATNAWSVRL
jgi:hypothetical protein